MIYENIEFFNVAEIRNGVLYRFPLRVCENLSVPEYDKQGNFLRIFKGHLSSARASYGTELRFVTEARKVTLHIEVKKKVRVSAYSGDYLLESVEVRPGEGNLTFSRCVATDGVSKRGLNRFPVDVWRICIDGEEDILFQGLETENGAHVRPPKEGECPRLRLLAYGTSISQGVGTPYPTLNYLSVAAQILKIDILNKAAAGGCFCEKETIEYLCSENFDAVYLEAGTNLADRPLSVIRERIGGLIDAFCSRFPDKTIFLMTPIRGLSDVSSTASDYRENFPKSRSVICEGAARYPNTVLLEGHGLLDKDYYLAADILHPSDFGHVMMGVNFAKMLAPYLSVK